MTIGYIPRPTARDYLSSIRGGAGPSFNYPVFKGRRRRVTGGRAKIARRRTGRRRTAARRARGRYYNARLHGEGAIRDIITKVIWPALKRIPAIFRSSAGKKVASTLASSGLAAGVNIAADKLAQPKVPLKKIAKVRGAEAVYKLMKTAKDKANEKMTGTTGSGGRRGRRRRVQRRVKRRRIRGGRRRRPGVKKRRRRVIKRRSTRGRRSVRQTRRKPDIFD